MLKRPCAGSKDAHALKRGWPQVWCFNSAQERLAPSLMLQLMGESSAGLAAAAAPQLVPAEAPARLSATCLLFTFFGCSRPSIARATGEEVCIHSICLSMEARHFA